MQTTEGQQGRVLAGRYELADEIGRGGMGIVWRAVDQVLGREVAAKRVSLRHGGAPQDLARAEREARLAASVSHAHAVSVFDLVEDGGERWLVMEYVEGRTLSALVRDQGPLDPDAAAPLVRQVAEALAAAHAAGIVHRDVKPSNILVTPQGRVKITDFGIARGDTDVTLTQTGMMTGSPAYLAPEVASGESATPASDVWALGATLFHALTGRPPYQVTDNVMATLYKIVHDDPPRPSDAGWLLPLLERTMAKDPSDRWAMREVTEFLADGPGDTAPTAVLGAPAPTPKAERTASFAKPAPVSERRERTERTERTERRSVPWLPLLLGVAVLVLAGLLGWALVGGDDGGEPAAEEPTASAEPTEEPDEAPSADEMESFVEDYLDTVTEDPRSTWQRLTPEFQRASGGYGDYQRWWGQFESADADNIQADPDTLTVSYDATYERNDGSTVTDSVSLELTEVDGELLISGES